MRRFSLTATPRKNINVKQTVTQTPNKSVSIEEQRGTRNLRDKEFKTACIETITKFLINNKYEGVISLNNPSTKELQNTIKFIVAFVDTSLLQKFEEDVLFLIKTLKYPYVNEITRSQLSSVTPHALPSLLSMTAWLTEVIEKTRNKLEEKSLETEFYRHTATEYNNFMSSLENDNADDDFIESIKDIYAKENEKIEEIKNEVELLESEYQSLKETFEDVDKLDQKIKKQNEEMNNLILQDKQVEIKRNKYIINIENMIEKIKEIQDKVDSLVDEKNSLKELIAIQDINMEDIHELNDEKTQLLKELEAIKPIRENKVKEATKLENEILSIKDECEKILNEVCTLKRVEKDELSLNYEEQENILFGLKENLVKEEINVKNLEEKLAELKVVENDLESQFMRYENRLNSINAVYLENKELFDKSYQTSIYEMDRQESDLLRLKVTTDSIIENCEKELTDAKIEYELMQTKFSKDNDSIQKTAWDLFNFMEAAKKNLNEANEELQKLMK
ncbi:hypothetical protein NUSPORA_00132 [Nucleospora cyclopteri]